MSSRPHAGSAPRDTKRRAAKEGGAHKAVAGDQSRTRKEPRDFKPPVAWLLGRELIASLKGMLIFSAIGSKLDARDWMSPSVYPAARQKDANRVWRSFAARSSGDESPAKSSGDSAADSPESSKASDEADAFWAERGEFWFDYISDTGDGMRATYSIAYLSMCDLWAAGRLSELRSRALPPPPERPEQSAMQEIGRVGFVKRAPLRPGEPADDAGDAGDAGDETGDAGGPPDYPNDELNLTAAQVAETAAGGDDPARTALPRGEFLLVGGDTSYHLSDYESLHQRFQLPFKWAYEDVGRDGRRIKAGRRPLFGIPGNHDYYDQLDGFRRQFREPIREDVDLSKERELEGPQLSIPGFVRCQSASYVALRLPFGWHLWGLDTELGKLDERQRAFFRNIPVEGDQSIEGKAQPDKLIVATCAPTTVFGKYADRDDERSAKAFYQLNLPRPFVKPSEEDAEDKRRKLRPDQCRLDLAGDIHLYARYWGREGGGRAPREGGGGARRESRPNYASVVSGLGGAFHHPTPTYAGEICEQALYPPQGRSRRAVAGKIFDPLWIMRGGGVWAIGAAVAFAVSYAALVSSALEKFPGINRDAPLLYWIGAALPFVSLGFGLAAIWVARHFYKKYWLHEEVLREHISEAAARRVDAETARAAKRHAEEQTARSREPHADQSEQSDSAWYERLMLKFSLSVSSLVLASAAALALSLALLAPYAGTKEHDWKFGNSLLMLFSLVWAGWATRLALGYTDWLSALASKITITRRHWGLVWLLGLTAAAGVVASFAVFGRVNSAAVTVADMLVALVVSAVVVALTLAGCFNFGKVHSGRRRFWRGALGCCFGLFHAVLQLALPYLLVTRATPRVWLVTIVLLATAQLAGRAVMRGAAWRWLLPAAWLLFGGMLLLPYRTWGWIDPLRELIFGPVAVFDPKAGHVGLLPFYVGKMFGLAFDSVWGALALCLLAGLVGVILSCVWVGWYFAVALAFDGHNNEAGGAARIERFKQFIRFRLTENDLTGFVIAVDEPKERGRELQPWLVDVIHLTAADADPASAGARK